jgi:hypothetical protein
MNLDTGEEFWKIAILSIILFVWALILVMIAPIFWAIVIWIGSIILAILVAIYDENEG